MDNVNNASTIAQADKEERGDTKTNIVFPSDLWREVKKAAIDAGMSATQFVVDVMRERVRPAPRRKAS